MQGLNRTQRLLVPQTKFQGTIQIHLSHKNQETIQIEGERTTDRGRHRAESDVGSS